MVMIESTSTWKSATSFHPLEIIPWFRRFPCSWWRNLIYTFIWNLLIAGFFIAIVMVFVKKPAGSEWLINILIIANCIGYSIHALFFITSHTIAPWIHRQGKLQITVFYAGISTFGVMTGYVFAAWLLGWSTGSWFGEPRWMVSSAITSVIISLIISAIFFSRERTARTEAALEREQLHTATIERQATLANLRALQAQIEPHFLFNTLANVASLIHAEPGKAKHMLESFIHYLRASLAANREAGTTLEREFDLMRSYLGLLQIRMGERLQARIEIPEGLGAFALPPMLLQPLVENAIKHGLEPKVEGGSIELTAQRHGNRVRITVADSGMGFTGATSQGVGLHNVRERLLALYGDRARLIVEDNRPGGTRVILEIPA